MMLIENEFGFEEIVYLKTDPDQRPRIITSVIVYPNGLIKYELSHSTSCSWHWECELSTTKDYSAVG